MKFTDGPIRLVLWTRSWQADLEYREIVERCPVVSPLGEHPVLLFHGPQGAMIADLSAHCRF